MAAHREDVEKRAVAMGEGVAVRDKRRVFNWVEVGRNLESMMSDLGAAMVTLNVWWRCWMRCALEDNNVVKS